MTRRRRSQAGFTLLELLIAIALTSLVVLSLPAVFQFARRSAAALADADRRASDRAALAFVEHRLEEVTPAERRDRSGQRTIAFKGEADRIGFVAPLAFLHEDSGLAEYELSFSGQAGLVMSWRPWRPPPAAAVEAPPDLPVRSRSLVPTARGLAFRYRGAPEADKPPAWVDTWPRPDVLPDVIEISLDTGSRIERRTVILRLKPPTRR